MVVDFTCRSHCSDADVNDDDVADVAALTMPTSMNTMGMGTTTTTA